MRDTAGQDRVVEERRPRWAIWASAALVMVLLGVVGVSMSKTWLRAEYSVPRERVRMDTVTAGLFVRDIPIQGSIVAATKPTVYAPSAGRVQLLVTPGDAVTAGDVVARIDSPQLQSDLEQARAELNGQRTTAEREVILARQQDLQNQQAVDLARVAVTAAARELRRAEASWEYQVISLQDLEQARDELERAELEFEHRTADAALAREQLEFERRSTAFNVEQQALRVAELERQMDALQVRAPVSGVIGTVSVEDRAAVAADAAIANVVDLSQLELEVSLAQGYADDIVVGMPASITYANQTYAAIVSAISPEVENNTVATRLRFADTQPDGLRQNQRLTGRIELDRLEDAVMVARGPWFDSGGGRVAYRVEGEFAVRRTIRTGATSAQFIQVLDGLSPGDSVIVSSTADFDSRDEILLTP